MPKITSFPILRSKFPRCVDFRSGSIGYVMVDARRNGRGRRHYVKTPAEAKVLAERISLEHQNHGVSALDLSASDRLMLAECRDLLRPHGLTIRDATMRLLKSIEVERSLAMTPTVSAAAIEYLAERERGVERGDLGQCSLVESRRVIRQLCSVMGSARICDLTVNWLTGYVNDSPTSPKTRLNLKLRLGVFLKFCTRRGWLDKNPATEVSVKVPQRPVVILSVEDAESLLRCAERSPHASTLLPFVSLGLMAGLRPTEAARLEWCNVDLARGHVRVLAATSKTREERFVPIDPALAAFLRPHARSSGLVVSKNHRKEWSKLMASAGYGPAHRWTPDACRHTFASMWLAQHRDRAHLAEVMGNSVQVIKKAYRAPVLPSVATRFWSLRPLGT